MTINNFEHIKHLIVEDNDLYYFAQIVQRRKDVPELNKNSYIVKSYYIKSTEHLEKMLNKEIIPICNVLNARCYINLSPRSYKRSCLEMLKKTTEYVINETYNAAKQAFDSVSGSYSIGRIFLFDIDVKQDLTELTSQLDNPLILETKSGYHVITKPFDVRNLKPVSFEYEIKKNNPTLLYAK
jgi:hypothetical protein